MKYKYDFQRAFSVARWGILSVLSVLFACSKEGTLPEPEDSTPQDSVCVPDTVPAEYPTQEYQGYARMGGTFLLSGGDRLTENGSITYIAPDGTVEPDLYKKINGSELGNDAQAMYLYKDKIYILCADYFRLDNNPGDGALIIVDAETFKKEKSFRLEDLRFLEPEGITNPDFQPIPAGLTSLAVMDEQNVFIRDVNGLYRFDSTTGELNLLEESFRVDNGGAGVAGRVYSRGMAIVGDKIYVAVGGWTSATDEYNLGIYEYQKGSNKLSRKLGISNGGYVSAICAGPEENIWFVTYAFNKLGRDCIYQVDTRSFSVVGSKRVENSLNSGFGNTPGVSVSGQKFYYSGMTTKLNCFDYQKGCSEFLVDALQDEPNARYVTCNPVFDAQRNLLYLATTEENMEGFPSTDHVLVYDCSVTPPVLKMNISGQTSYVTGIYPVSMFHNK